MELHSKNGIAWYQFHIFSQFPQLIHAVTTRGIPGHEISMRSSCIFVEQNRSQVATALGISASALIVGHQVHGQNISKVTKSDIGRGSLSQRTAIPDSDGLITSDLQVPIMALSADCVLVALFCPSKHTIATIHAGWRGTMQMITQKAAWMMQQEYGCPAQDIFAGIAPSIGPCCYVVGNDVIEAAKHIFSEHWLLYKNGQVYLDLWKANAEQLQKTGILPEHIETSQLCSYCHAQDFFSFRREGKDVGHIGLILEIRELA